MAGPQKARHQGRKWLSTDGAEEVWNSGGVETGMVAVHGAVCKYVVVTAVKTGPCHDT